MAKEPISFRAEQEVLEMLNKFQGDNYGAKIEYVVKTLYNKEFGSIHPNEITKYSLRINILQNKLNPFTNPDCIEDFIKDLDECNNSTNINISNYNHIGKFALTSFSNIPDEYVDSNKVIDLCEAYNVNIAEISSSRVRHDYSFEEYLTLEEIKILNSTFNFKFTKMFEDIYIPFSVYMQISKLVIKRDLIYRIIDKKSLLDYILNNQNVYTPNSEYVKDVSKKIEETFANFMENKRNEEIKQQKELELAKENEYKESLVAKLVSNELNFTNEANQRLLHLYKEDKDEYVGYDEIEDKYLIERILEEIEKKYTKGIELIFNENFTDSCDFKKVETLSSSEVESNLDLLEILDFLEKTYEIELEIKLCSSYEITGNVYSNEKDYFDNENVYEEEYSEDDTNYARITFKNVSIITEL